MDKIKSLNARDARFRFQIDADQWCEVFVLIEGAERKLGAESFL